MKRILVTFIVCCAVVSPVSAISSNGRKLVRTSNGDLYCTYDRPGSIYCAKSTNGGQNWTETQIVNEDYYQYDPSIAVDSKDNIHIVWSGRHAGSPTNYQIRYIKYTGSWQSILNLTNENDSGNSQQVPAIAIDSNDYVHITWQGRFPGLYIYNPQIRYIKYTGSWGAIQNLTNGSYAQKLPSIAIDSNDHVHIVWQENYLYEDRILPQIKYIKYTVSWQPVESLTAPPDDEEQNSPCIAIDSNDYVHIAWVGTFHLPNDYWINQVRYIKYTNSWGDIQFLSDRQQNQQTPTIAIDANNYVDVVWSGPHVGSTSTYQIRHRKYTNGWGAIENMTSSSSNQTLPNLIWALHPTVVRARTNRTQAGYAFIWMDGTTVRFYGSPDLVWAVPGKLYNLTVNVTGNGSVTKTPNKTVFEEGETVTLQAVGNAGYKFVNWSGDLSGGSNPATVVMNSHKSITANFALGTHTLTTVAVNGSITRNPDQASYAHATFVQLEAIPNAGYHFVSWSGDALLPGNIIYMDSDKQVTANFAINTYTLNVTATNGSVTKTPDKTSYLYGETVTLQATADAGYHFVNWSGDSSGSENPKTLNMDSNKSITANFAVNMYTLDVTVANGSVTKNPDKDTYVHGETVTLQANPDAGCYFAGWTGDLSGSNNPETLVMNSNKSITADIRPYTYTLTITAVNGSVTKTPNKASYLYDETVILEAIPNTGYHFSNWSAGLSGNPASITMDSDKSVTANFLPNNPSETVPYVKDRSPDADAIQVPVNSIVTLHVADAGKGVDANTVTIRVNGDIVYVGNTANYASEYGSCHMVGTKADYTFIYQPNNKFDFDKEVTVTVNAANLSGNAMAQQSYKFSTEMRSFGQNSKINSGLTETISEKPATVRDSNGNILAVWQAGPVGSRSIYFCKFSRGGYGFSMPIKLADHVSDQCNPVIALDSNNYIYVVWQDNYFDDWDIFAMISPDGEYWTDVLFVATTDDNETNPAIAIDRNSPNRVYVAYESNKNNNQDIFVASSDDGFATVNNLQITSLSSNQTEPAIAVDSGGVAYVAWTHKASSSTDIYAAASNNSWQNVAIVNNVKNQSSPAIATENSGSILHWLWVDDTPGNSDIYYAMTNGLPNSPITGASIIDDTTKANQLDPAIAVNGSTDENLTVFACWTDWRNIGSGGDSDLYFVELTSDGKTNVFVGDNTKNSNQTEPAIGVDMYGYPYLLWTDSTDEVSNVYYAGSTFIYSYLSGNVTASTDTIVGTDPKNIMFLGDISVTLPAGSCPSDLIITVSNIRNRPGFFLNLLSSYDFGPSGLNFSQPVTVTIPYYYNDGMGKISVYWYNPLTGAFSQQGVTNVKSFTVGGDLRAVQFKTTHFTQFYVGYADASSGSSSGGGDSSGGGSGGGCSLSTTNHGSAVDFFLPYLALAAILTLLRLRDVRNLDRRKG